MKHYLLLPALALLAACDMTGPGPYPLPDPPVRAEACAPDQSLIGQPASVLAAMTFPMGTRIFNTGDALTMDFRPDRLNIEIGAAGTIVAVSCG